MTRDRSVIDAPRMARALDTFYLNLLFDTPRAKCGGFPRAVQIFRSQARLEERLLSAIQWAGKATVEECLRKPSFSSPWLWNRCS